MNAQPLWLFLHLPKTGGTTLKAHLETHLKWDEELIDFSRWGRSYRARNDRPEFGDRSPTEQARARVLAGHDVTYGLHRLLPDREPRYFTFVRDPADRCVSLYNFRRSRGVTSLGFEEWYALQYRPRYRESMVRFFATRLFNAELGDHPEEHLALAISLLQRCWHVGTTESLPGSLDLLCDAIGVPRGWRAVRDAGGASQLDSPTHPDRGERIARHVRLDDAMRSQIYADSPCDLALLDWARSKNSIS